MLVKPYQDLQSTEEIRYEEELESITDSDQQIRPPNKFAAFLLLLTQVVNILVACTHLAFLSVNPTKAAVLKN